MFRHLGPLWKVGLITLVTAEYVPFMPMPIFIVNLHCLFWHFRKAAIIFANNFGSISVMCLHVTSDVCCCFPLVVAQCTRLQPLFQMGISNVSSQCWWCGHCYAALVTLMIPEMNPNMVPHQLRTVEILSTFLTWKVSISGGETFPQKVSSGLGDYW